MELWPADFNFGAQTREDKIETAPTISDILQEPVEPTYSITIPEFEQFKSFYTPQSIIRCDNNVIYLKELVNFTNIPRYDTLVTGVYFWINPTYTSDLIKNTLAGLIVGGARIIYKSVYNIHYILNTLSHLNTIIIYMH